MVLQRKPRAGRGEGMTVLAMTANRSDFDQWLTDRGSALLSFAWLVTRNREDCSFADIARILEIPESTARSHVHRALARLRALLEAQR